MQADLPSPGDMAKRVVSLVRTAMVCTLTLAAVLLLADFAGRGWIDASLRFMSETVVVVLVAGLAVEVVVAITAITLIWRLAWTANQ